MGENITLEDVLADKDFRKKFNEIIINNNKPISINKNDYKIIEGRPKYTDAKNAGRSGTAIAIISKNTLAVYKSENITYPEPINWDKAMKYEGVFNRSHIIGYRLSAKRTNSNNIFIGTAYMNQITMKNIENELYKKIKEYNRIYLYKVTPIYKCEQDTIHIGILMEADSIDNLEKDQMCKFCYNIQNGVNINYCSGSHMPMEKFYNEIEPQEFEEDESKEDLNNKYRNYSINIKTFTFHLISKHCSNLHKVDPKYIQETRANEEDLIKKGFKSCKKCNIKNIEKHIK